MKDKIIEYLKGKGINLKEEFIIKYLDKNHPVSEEDEYKHEIADTYPTYHNESWYFNCMDFNSNVHIITRLSYNAGDGTSDILLVLVIDGKVKLYVNRAIIKGMPDTWGDKRLTYECLVPLKKWRITFYDRKFSLDIVSEGRFPVFTYSSDEDPSKIFEEFGYKILDVATQMHYEQSMRVTGTLKIKKTDELRKINGLGHRDHSWGTRDWVGIDGWNWICAQFEDKVLNLTKTKVFGKFLEIGFISSADKVTPIRSVDIKTKYGFKGEPRAPISSTFHIKTDDDEFDLVATTDHAIRLIRPTEKGITEIWEQIVKFDLKGEKGAGISEYMSSVKD